MLRESPVTVISDELATQIIRNAFSPLHCGVEVCEYDNNVRLNVVDDSNVSFLKLAGITPDEFGDTNRLRVLLEQLREDLIHLKGVQLDPWKMPDVKVIAT